jgi:PBS lyase HEAT-like repeat
MGHRKVEQEIEALADLCRAGLSDAGLAALRKALKDRINLVVAKAAKLAGELHAAELTPDLAASFDRLMEKPVARDPQCWGKNAIASALVALDYREPELFLRGARHIQMEPVWGAEEDTAQVLRGICLLALPACERISREEVLRCLVDGLAEPAQNVRQESVRAIAQMAGPEAAPVLRLKARVGDEESAVIGQVFDALVQLEGAAALPFLASFLYAGRPETREEAALALGASRLPEAVEILRTALDAARDCQFREVLMRALSASRQPEAIDVLLNLFNQGRSADREAALAALELHRETPAIWSRVEAARNSRATDGWQEKSVEGKL